MHGAQVENAAHRFQSRMLPGVINFHGTGDNRFGRLCFFSDDAENFPEGSFDFRVGTVDEAAVQPASGLGLIAPYITI